MKNLTLTVAENNSKVNVLHSTRSLLNVQEELWQIEQNLTELIEEIDSYTGGIETLLKNDTDNIQSSSGRNCTKAAIFEFPSDGLTRYQRKHGWILIHFALACYCFCLLAIVCDDYFVPAIEAICACKCSAELFYS